MEKSEDKAIVLLSGGLDSATVLAITKSHGYAIYALTFSYGQRHQEELLACSKVARAMGVIGHKVVNIDLATFGGSALTSAIPVPKGRLSDDFSENGIPITYVPARNTIFLSYALAWAEVLEAKAIYLGVNAVDYSGYPDCRPEFIEAYQTMANLATKGGVEGEGYRICAPIVHMTKAEIIRLGTALGVDYSLTHSCYDPVEGLACGDCDSCLIRRRGFVEAKVPDPTEYCKQ